MQSLQKQIIYFKLESAYGVDSTPVATDAVLCGSINISPLEGATVERNIMMPYFGNLGSIRTENYVKISFEVELAGSGTAGTAPKLAPLLKACNFSETLTAAPITATGLTGTANTIGLAVTASTVDDIYTGMSISITGGTGVGQIREIVSYAGATKMATLATNWAVTPDATSVYAIGANAMYTPNSSIGPVTLTSGVIHWYNDGKRHILLGARGSFKPDLSVKAEGKASFEFTGLLGTYSDTAFPAANFTGWQVPVTISTANTTDLNILGFTGAGLALDKFSIDIGNKVIYRQLVGQESVLITDRNVTGSISLEDIAFATKDYFSMAKNSGEGVLCIKHGQTPGNIVGITGRSVQPTNPKFSNKDDINMLDLGLEFMPFLNAGNDEIRICFK